MKKKGVITPFIIVGLVLLIMIGLFVLMRNYTYAGQFVPSPLIPATTFAQECTEQVTDDALFFLRTQGGYIYLPDKIGKDPQAYINLGMKVPYWFHNYQERIPLIRDMELDMERYVKDNVVGCINNFNSVEHSLTLQNPSKINELSVEVRINNQDVEIEIIIPVIFKSVDGSKSYNLPKIHLTEETELRNMYELAKEIMKAENKDAFLEGYVFDMIATSDYLPHEGLEITCEPRIWEMMDLEKHLQMSIMHNIRYITFENTQYEDTGIDYYDKIYRVDLGVDDYSNIKVNTIYNPQWPLNLNVNPKSNGVVKPIEYPVSKFMFNCFKIYHHKYSVEFPIMFQLVANNNPDEMFYFATPVVMKRDEPNRYDEVPTWPEEVDQTRSEDYCRDEVEVSIYKTDMAGNIIVQPSIEKKRKTMLDIYAIDKTLGFPEGTLKDVEIKYHCVKFRCDMGNTTEPKIDGFYIGEPATLSTEFPFCFNGYVIAEKEGYLTAREKISITEDNNEELSGTVVNIEMKPLKDFKYEFVVVEDHNNIISERPLNEDEGILLMLNSPDNLHEQTIYFPYEEEGQVSEQIGSLSALGNANDEEVVNVEETELSPFEKLSLVVDDNVLYNLDIKLVEEDQVWGGASYNWTISYSEVMTNNKVRFYVAKKDMPQLPSSGEDWQELYNELQKRSEEHMPEMLYVREG
jgi:hypothetical protein